MKLRTGIYAILMALFSCLFWNCTHEETEEYGGQGGAFSGLPEITLNKKSPRGLMGVTLSDLAGRQMKIGATEVQPRVDQDGRWFLDYVADASSYLAVFDEKADLPYGEGADDMSARVPCFHFYDSVAVTMKPYPLFAKKNPKYGDYALKDGFAMLNLQINGNASIKSIKVRSENGSSLSADGLDFVVLNCISSDHGPVSLPAVFQIPVGAGIYGDLEITICDNNNRMQRLSANINVLLSGDAELMTIDYEPSSDLLFYEGFDNCVWGSDPDGLRKGYSPDGKDPGNDGLRLATGYETAYVECKSACAGTGLLQTEDVEGKYVMTDSYIRSRGFDTWKYLLRVKEFQGCVGVGVEKVGEGFSRRGWVHTPAVSTISEGENVRLSFRFMLVPEANENLEIQCIDGGTLSSYVIDSEKETAITDSGSSYTLDTKELRSGWHKMDLVVKKASPNTSFRIGGKTKNGVKHGFFIDDITVRKTMGEVPGLSSLTTLSTVQLSFKLQFDSKAEESMKISLPTGGFFTGLKVDDRAVKDPDTSRESWLLRTEYVFECGKYSSGTHDVVFTIESADKDMTLNFEGGDCSCSDLAIKKISSIEKGQNGFRVLLWNIQYGMWADQGNDYDNFVAWLKKYDADCCVFIEAETAYKTGSSAPETTIAQKKLNGSEGGSYSSGGKKGWAALASRYGHNSVATSADVDNYSQEITSKKQIDKVLDIHDTGDKNKPVHHGSGYFTITVGGKKINIVTYHAMPYNYDPKANDKVASESAREGDAYRLNEVKYILGQTVNSSKYSSESNWIFLGDMNSHAIVDRWYYGYSESSTIWDVQKYIREYTNLTDVMVEKYPNRFMATTMNGKFRIDYMYVSPSLINQVKNAVVIRDKWTSEKPSGVEDWTSPSDHRPILVDFNF